LADVSADAAALPVVKQKIGRDDWTMRAFMVAIALYLVVALALPLYAMMSKSFETYRFELNRFEVQVDT